MTSISPRPRRPAGTRAARGPRGPLRALKIGGLALALIIVLPLAAYGMPKAFGLEAAYVVLSGSMEPLYSPGDIVYDEGADPADLKVGDIITFRAAAGSNRLYTHRIIEVRDAPEGLLFRTQGDANEDPDPGFVTPDRLTGRVIFHLPYYGHLVAFATSKMGYFVLVLLPGVAVIGHQLSVMVRAIVALEREKEAKKGAAPKTETTRPRRARAPRPSGATPAPRKGRVGPPRLPTAVGPRTPSRMPLAPSVRAARPEHLGGDRGAS